MISLFFLHSVPELQRLSLGWTALLGAIFLIILADIEDMEAILARVEWSTLLFFAALFILMEALSELGLIEWIGNMTENIILGVGEESRLMVAVLIILWVSWRVGRSITIQYLIYCCFCYYFPLGFCHSLGLCRQYTIDHNDGQNYHIISSK